MAIDLQLGDVSVDPRSIPSEGGSVSVTVEASTVTGSANLVIRYEIPQAAPYVFVKPADPAKPKVDLLTGQKVGVALKNYTKTLALKAVPGTEPPLSFTVDLEVRPVDAQGNNVGDPQADAVTLRVQPDDLGAALLAHRQAAALTQEEAADRMNLSSSTISRIERGGHNPSDDTVDAVMDLLHGTQSS